MILCFIICTRVTCAHMCLLVSSTLGGANLRLIFNKMQGSHFNSSTEASFQLLLHKIILCTVKALCPFANEQENAARKIYLSPYDALITKTFLSFRVTSI